MAFPKLAFRGELRPSQADAIEIVADQLKHRGRRVHIVAPPGAGKTILGLYLWAELVQEPALVLSPNSAIQSQWVERARLFLPPSASAAETLSTDPASPAALTSLTYQSVTLPRRGDSELDVQALDVWADTLAAKEQADDPEAAAIWIQELAAQNPEYYAERLGHYRKKIRGALSAGGDALSLLHANSIENLKRLRDHGVGMLILDECHHLLGHWGRVLASVDEFFGQPIVVGLTATPPDQTGVQQQDAERYQRFFGAVDYEVPVPALVRDGFLAPYQDLAFFVRPEAGEMEYIANTDKNLTALIEELCEPRQGSPTQSQPETLLETEQLLTEAEAASPTDRESRASEPGRALLLLDWLTECLVRPTAVNGSPTTWKKFEKQDPDFACCARVFLASHGRPLPPGVPPLNPGEQGLDASSMEVLVPVLDRYVRHALRRSASNEDHELAVSLIARLRAFGVQITETGCRPSASPVSRVMGYSRAKAKAIVPILKAEMAALHDRVRAIIVCDYEKTSAVQTEISHLLDEEAGGAVAAFRAVLSDAETDTIDPVLVTGSTVLVDDDLADRFISEAHDWLTARGLDIKLRDKEEDGFHVLLGAGSDWCPRVYVNLITDLFQQGVTRCLVGTRGLLGEGWDASRINVLIDLTTVTTSMSVNQLRGRSIRLDEKWPGKVANNWDVVCIAPEFRKGLDDYHRFMARHKTLFGVTDDGAIEKGVGHVHPAFTEIKPEGVEGAVGPLNEDMLARVQRRAEARELWAVGTPYVAEPVIAAEAHVPGGGGFPPFSVVASQWSEESLGLALGRAVLDSLQAEGLIQERCRVNCKARTAGYIRVFLRRAEPVEMELFTSCIRELLGPLDQARYIIPRYADFARGNWISRLLPETLARYFRRRRCELTMWHAVPNALARNKSLVESFEKAWHLYVGPGKAVFVRRGQGEELLAQVCRDGLMPRAEVRQKEIFF